MVLVFKALRYTFIPHISNDSTFKYQTVFFPTFISQTKLHGHTCFSVWVSVCKGQFVGGWFVVVVTFAWKEDRNSL